MWWTCADCKKRNLQHREFCACGGTKPAAKGLVVAGAIAALVAAYTPAWADYEHRVILRTTAITPPTMPDVNRDTPMVDLAACMESAQAFLEQDLDAVKVRVPQAVGLAATCGVLEKPSIKN